MPYNTLIHTQKPLMTDGLDSRKLQEKIGKKIADILTERGHSGEDIDEARSMFFAHKPFNRQWSKDVREAIFVATAQVTSEYYTEYYLNTFKDIIRDKKNEEESLFGKYEKILTDPDMLIDYVVEFFHPIVEDENCSAYPVKDTEMYDKFKKLAYCVLKDIKTPDELAQ